MGNDILSNLARATGDISILGCEFALVGALAIGVRTQPLTTFDVDLALAVDGDVEAERVVRELITMRGYKLIRSFEHENGRLTTVRFCFPDATDLEPQVDLLFATSGIEPEIVEKATSLALGSAGTQPVSQIGHLIAMKVLSESDVRPKDKVHLAQLLDCASESDLALARLSINLIEERGYSRGKALNEVLEREILLRERREDLSL